MKIAITTVFLPRENIYWLEEWIRYHLFHIGIDAIYLYDNTGSLKLDHLPLNKEISVALSGKNLRGENVASFTAHLSDADIQSILNKIIDKYHDRVCVVPWHPVDKQGTPCYGQIESYQHFLGHYGNLFDWVCLTDIDEFITNTDLREKVTSFEKCGFNDIIIHPKLFTQRFGPSGPFVPMLSITDGIENITDRYWKRIVKCSETIRPSVHQGGEWRGGWKPLFDTGLVFHHYKIGPWCYQKMRNEIAFCPKTLRVATDESLKKVIPTLLLEQNIFVPLPADTVSFKSEPRTITLPQTSLFLKLRNAKEYFVLCAIFRFRFIGTIWYHLKGKFLYS